MAGDLIKFVELPGLRELEDGCKNAAENRLMLDYRAELFQALDRKSLELFGITQQDAAHDPADGGQYFRADEGWEQHFEFLDWIDDEEPAFWSAFGLDMTNNEGEPLYCIDAFGRQLVCALKQLHPKAR